LARSGIKHLPCKLVVSDIQESNGALHCIAMYHSGNMDQPVREVIFILRPPEGFDWWDLTPAPLSSPLPPLNPQPAPAG
jgi:hypothetical protein